MKKIFVAVYFAFIFCTLTPAQTGNSTPVTLNRTEVHKITSVSNGVIYPIFISLPAGYGSNDKKYPVVYMLDAYSSFGIVMQSAKLLAYNKELPDLIIVGISSEGGSKEFNYNRGRDYTPTIVTLNNQPGSYEAALPASGGADKFLSFITNDLIPFVESKYNIIPGERTLIGHSLGGLFVTYSLFENPDIFQRYVIISPALFWDDNYILKMENRFYQKRKSINAIIYTSVGSLEPDIFKTPWTALVESVKARNYSGLRLIQQIAENESHYTIIPHLVTKGLVSVFKENLKDD